MTDASVDQAPTGGSAALTNAMRTAAPPLLFGLRLWASVSIALYVAFWLELDKAYWAGTSAAFVCQPQLGASLRKGWYRMVGTLIGAVAIVVLTACLVQSRVAFLSGLALWCAACALVATLLRNYAAYAAALAGYTAAIIAGDDLGATGGPSGQVFMLAVARASEICIGIVCAGIVLAGTDFGVARRKLAALLATMTAEITGRFTGMLALAGPDLPETLPARRELARRVIALDPIIDQAKGESSQLRYHSPVMQSSVDGLLAALAGWRAVAVRLARLPNDIARQEARAVLRHIPLELQSDGASEPTRWLADPIGLRRSVEAAVRTLRSFSADAPSLRLLADQTAEVLAGISDALDGLALLIGDRIRPVSRHGSDLRVPDWLPALVNAGRAFVAIGAVEIFWVLTAWPNGASAISFAAIVVLVFVSRGDQAYVSAAGFMIGTALAAAFAAILKFAVLPGLETFVAFSIAIGVYLVPVGALVARPQQTALVTAMASAMAGIFVPILAPANEMSYDTLQFYNAALAIVAGCAVAALSFLLVSPLSPRLRTRRLLELTLRDLRRLAVQKAPWQRNEWEDRIFGRLAAMPDEAEPLQRAELLAALSVGTAILQLRQVVPQLGLGSELDTALDAVARGESAAAAARFVELDGRLASRLGDRPTTFDDLRARASTLAISEALDEHASFFDTGAQM